MKTVSEINNTEESPFDFFSRDQWDRLADRSPLPLTHTDLSRLASLGDPIDIAEVDAIYRPLTALLQLYVEGHRRVEHERSHFLSPSLSGSAARLPLENLLSPASYVSSCPDGKRPRELI